MTLLLLFALATPILAGPAEESDALVLARPHEERDVPIPVGWRLTSIVLHRPALLFSPNVVWTVTETERGSLDEFAASTRKELELWLGTSSERLDGGFRVLRNSGLRVWFRQHRVAVSHLKKYWRAMGMDPGADYGLEHIASATIVAYWRTPDGESMELSITVTSAVEEAGKELAYIWQWLDGLSLKRLLTMEKAGEGGRWKPLLLPAGWVVFSFQMTTADGDHWPNIIVSSSSESYPGDQDPISELVSHTAKSAQGSLAVIDRGTVSLKKSGARADILRCRLRLSRALVSMLSDSVPSEVPDVSQLLALVRGQPASGKQLHTLIQMSVPANREGRYLGLMEAWLDLLDFRHFGHADLLGK